MTKQFKNKKDKNQKKETSYQEEIAQELMTDKQNLWQTNTVNKRNQFQQEMAEDFLQDKKTRRNRSQYTVPELNEKNLTTQDKQDKRN